MATTTVIIIDHYDRVIMTIPVAPTTANVFNSSDSTSNMSED